MKLSDRAILLSLRISAWSATAVEKNGARAIERDNDASIGTVIARKALMPGFPELEKLKQHNTAFRHQFNEKTLAYSDGTRLAPVDTAQDLIRWCGEQMDIGAQLADDVSTAYPDHLQNAEDALGKLFDRKLYPSPAEIRNKFSYRLTPTVVPESDELRNFPGFSADEVDGIVQNAKQAQQEQFGEAMRDVWERIYKVTSAMHEKLSVPLGEKGGIFRDSLVGNMKELAALLPTLNIFGDPQIDSLARTLKAEGETNLNTLRTDAVARAEKAERARKLAEVAKSYLF